MLTVRPYIKACHTIIELSKTTCQTLVPVVARSSRVCIRLHIQQPTQVLQRAIQKSRVPSSKACNKGTPSCQKRGAPSTRRKHSNVKHIYACSASAQLRSHYTHGIAHLPAVLHHLADAPSLPALRLVAGQLQAHVLSCLQTQEQNLTCDAYSSLNTGIICMA